MPRAALPGQHVKRLQRLLTLVQDLKADPRQPPEALWASLGISRAMFYKDRQALAALGFTFHYDRRQQRLFLPEAWFTDAYAARLTTCNIPWELAFQSKPQLAAAMVQAITREGLLPFKYVVADRLYENSPDFLDALDACGG